MAYKVLLSRLAESDIDESFMYFEATSPDYASAWKQGLLEVIQSLAELPLRMAVLPESREGQRELRAAIHESHKVVFEVAQATKTVTIVRVYHSSRQPLTIKNISK